MTGLPDRAQTARVTAALAAAGLPQPGRHVAVGAGEIRFAPSLLGAVEKTRLCEALGLAGLAVVGDHTTARGVRILAVEARTPAQPERDGRGD